MRVTIGRIAEEAGVSEATVSHVLNDKGKVSREVRDRIKAIIKKHKYKPRKKSHPAVPGTVTKSIAVVYPHLPGTSYQEKCGEPFTSTILAGIEQTLAAVGLSMSMCTATEEGQLPPSCAEGKVDGAIALFDGLTSSVPQISMFSPTFPTNADGVYPDYVPCGMIAADRLVSLGSTNCVFLNTQSQHTGFVQRKLAFQQALASHGMDCALVEGPADGTEAPIAELVDRMLDECPDADGVFLPGSDVHVAALCMELQKRGKPPLDDFHVISCLSNVEMLGPLNLGIDFIDIRLHELGVAAAETLLWRLQNKKAPHRRVLVAPSLIPKGGEG